MSNPGSGRRERAAAANASAMSSERRRERTVRIVGAITVVVVVVAIIVTAVWVKRSGSDSGGSATPTATADPNAKLPTGVLATGDPYEYGVPYGKAGANVPVLEIWEDFQCPSCDAVEKANGAGIEALANQGKIRLIWRPTTFLDGNLKNDSSSRAAAAWGCAIDAGKAAEYHNTIYANQPKEGVGYTDANFVEFAKTSGITGAALDTFTTCLNDHTYLPWAATSTQVFYDKNIPGTPAGFLDGTEVAPKDLADPAALTALIDKATAAKASGGAASPSAASPAAASPAAS